MDFSFDFFRLGTRLVVSYYSLTALVITRMNSLVTGGYQSSHEVLYPQCVTMATRMCHYSNTSPECALKELKWQLHL